MRMDYLAARANFASLALNEGAIMIDAKAGPEPAGHDIRPSRKIPRARHFDAPRPVRNLADESMANYQAGSNRAQALSQGNYKKYRI